MDGDDLEQRAQADGAAALALAEKKLLGIGEPADARAAYELVRHAAGLGHAEARRAWVYLVGAGIGHPKDPEGARAMLAELAKEDRFAAAQLAFLGHLTCEQRARTVAPTVIRDDPSIRLWPQLFSVAECRYLMVLGTPWLERARVIDEATGEGLLDPVRDADNASFPHLAEDLVVQAINRAIATASGTEPEWGEPLQVLRYAPRQQYHEHHDAGDEPDPRDRRGWTALIWLNDDYEGGETFFPTLGVKVRGGVGDLLVFRNLTDGGAPDPRMRHAGLPVTSGVKWLASRWVRGRGYLNG